MGNGPEPEARNERFEMSENVASVPVKKEEDENEAVCPMAGKFICCA